MCGLTVEKRNIDHNFIRLFLMFRKHTKIETVWKLFLKGLIKISLCTAQVYILHQLDISNGGWRYQGCCSSLLFYVVSVFLGIKLLVNKYASNYLRFRLFGSFLSCYSHFLESLTHVIQISFFLQRTCLR